MEKIIQSLNVMQSMNKAYGLSDADIQNTLNIIQTAKVCTPVIGKFSSGKSALMNTILGYSRRILKEDITPETAVPTEIAYSDNEEFVTIFENNGAEKNVTVSDYRSMELDANKVKCVRLNLRNSNLEEIPDVMLVDMPGFESGLEIHNKAINDYLPHSMAYIVAIPATDMTVRSTVGNILKELCLHDMPICVVITKYDQKNDEFNISFEKLKEGLKRFVGERKITYCITSSFDRDVDELKEFLEEIQEQSQVILANRFKKSVFSIMDVTESYLKTSLKANEMSESELGEEEEKLGRKMSDLNESFLREKEDFEAQLSTFSDEVAVDVQNALERNEETIITMAMENSGKGVNEYINQTVRNTVTRSVQERFIPRVEKYLKRVDNCLNGDTIGDVHINLNIDLDGLKKSFASQAATVLAGWIIAGPIGGIIAAIYNKLSGDKREKKAREEIKNHLHRDTYPQVLTEVEHKIQIEALKQIKLINTSIEAEIQSQQEALEKAMADVRSRIKNEAEKKENLAIDIQNDLKTIAELRESL